MGNITLNPMIQTNALGSFVIESNGCIIGTAEPDPATRFALAGGILDNSETLPMWGGVGIEELIPSEAPTSPRTELGPHIKRATATANLLGFAVFDQNYAAINHPQSPVPQTPVGGRVHYYRLGSGARIRLEIDPTLVSIEGDPTNQAVGWDFTNQKIIAGTGFPGKILRILVGNSMAPVYNAGSGFLTWNRAASAAIALI